MAGALRCARSSNSQHHPTLGLNRLDYFDFNLHAFVAVANKIFPRNSKWLLYQDRLPTLLSFLAEISKSAIGVLNGIAASHGSYPRFLSMGARSGYWESLLAAQAHSHAKPTTCPDRILYSGPNPVPPSDAKHRSMSCQ